MRRLKTALAKVLRAGTRTARTTRPPAVAEAVSTQALHLSRLSDAVASLGRRLDNALEDVDRQLQTEQERAQDLASVAGLPRATLLTESVVLDGSASDRLHVKRVRVGDRVERPFSRWVGITRCATESPDVRDLWERLLRFEAECGDDVLRAFPSTILDVPGAAARVVDRTLRISPRGQPQSAGVFAVPRCTYEVTSRKVGNFGHWMLDFAPQIVALGKVAPDATILMPQPARPFQSATLALMGLHAQQLVPWDGSPIECGRLLAFEGDGRTGGGRPLSPLLEVRRLLAPSAPPAAGRRIYVSRRDAPKKRKWISNEAAVEEVFRSRGFEIVVMRDCPLEEQVRLFKEARVVAGLNGGGLTDIVFSPRGTHVIVLLSDTLIRWYAGGGRAAWAGGRRGGEGQLAALGDSPHFWTHVAAAFEQRCHSFVGGDTMPLDVLGQFLDDVLAEVDRS